MAPSTSSKKDLGVVILLITAEREQASFFRQEGSFFCACATSFPARGFWEFLHFFVSILNLIFFLFSFYLSL